MGIRFACPNGHRLNVKAHLAGQRGICPKCGVTVKIPELPATDECAQQAADYSAAASASIILKRPKELTKLRKEIAEQTNTVQESASSKNLLASSAPVVKEPEVSSPSEQQEALPSPPTAPVPQPSATPGIWYVRPPAGGQFGPAEEETFCRWIREHRVVPDSYVWREGWTDWQQARNVADLLPIPLSQSNNSQDDSAQEVASIDTDFSEPSAALLSLRKSRQRANRIQLAIAILLALTVIVLLAILIRVLLHDPPPESHRGGVVETVIELASDACCYT